MALPAAPPVVRDALRKGVVESYFLFPENGPVRQVERWEAPAIHDPAVLSEVEAYLAKLEAALAPAERGELLARVLALLSHYRLEPHPAQVEMRIADDWAEDLGVYPMWAVEEAARQWRRTRKFKPQISEMIALCDEAVGEAPQVCGRLRRISERSRAEANPLARSTRALVSGMLSRLNAAA